MNYKDTVNARHGERWIAEVEKEYQQMLGNKKFE
jgi:hypothetical protein